MPVLVEDLTPKQFQVVTVSPSSLYFTDIVVISYLWRHPQLPRFMQLRALLCLLNFLFSQTLFLQVSQRTWRGRLNLIARGGRITPVCLPLG